METWDQLKEYLLEKMDSFDGSSPMVNNSSITKEQYWNSQQGVNMKCSIKDYKGNHCPEIPKHHFIRNNETVSLCDRCFANYKKGAYGDSFTSDNSEYTKLKLRVFAGR